MSVSVPLPLPLPLPLFSLTDTTASHDILGMMCAPERQRDRETERQSQTETETETEIQRTLHFVHSSLVPQITKNADFTCVCDSPGPLTRSCCPQALSRILVLDLRTDLTRGNLSIRQSDLFLCQECINSTALLKLHGIRRKTTEKSPSRKLTGLCGGRQNAQMGAANCHSN